MVSESLYPKIASSNIVYRVRQALPALIRAPLIFVGHVNNLVYNRLAESGRVNWVGHHSRGASPEEKQGWDELITPLSIGLILGSIQTIFKFVSFSGRTLR